MGRDRDDGNQMFLSTLPAGRSERRLALTVILASCALFAVFAPFAKRPLPVVGAFIPIYESALVMNDLITAMLLFGQFSSLRSRALLALGSGYLFTAGMTIVHGLTFPGLFAPAGLLGAGSQSTAWIYMFWHAGFPCFVTAYVLLGKAAHGERRAMPRRSARASIAWCVLAAAALVCVLTAFATMGKALLPDLLVNGRFTWAYRWVIGAVWLASPFALAMLWRHGKRTALDMWLMVVMVAWMIDIALAAMLNHGRFDLGFYAGRIYGLLAASFVLIVLLVESGTLYARLVALTRRDMRRDMRERMRVKELEHLGHLSAGIQAAREEEQKRIARELHDDLGQRLTALKIDLTMLESDLDDRTMAPALRGRARSMMTLIDETVRSVRHIAAGLRPTVLDDLGLVPALEWLAGDFESRNGIVVDLLIDIDDLNIDSAAATAVYRIVQEALTNIAKHSEATEVQVEVVLDGDACRVGVADNGRGSAVSAMHKEQSFGLLGIRERVRQLNGAVSVDTAPGEGFRLSVSLPASALNREEPV
ncbi:sensor histidine kinase [Paraburkholderia sp. A2WS-5]|uniref:sensor histidine kinase n=1 Tax=unclassified Paraburkholderia TaxID=2615204 RepID=UPI003B77A989